MCDYSLHAVATRPAKVAETLVSTKFSTGGTRGFASPDDPKVAVCLRPGTEIAFENDVQTGGMMFRKNIGVRLARFRQIDLNKPYQHHDALELSNGAIVLVTNLTAGQRATVLQLPASPIEERPQRPNLQLGMRPLTSDGQKGPGSLRASGRLKGYIRPSSI